MRLVIMSTPCSYVVLSCKRVSMQMNASVELKDSLNLNILLNMSLCLWHHLGKLYNIISTTNMRYEKIYRYIFEVPYMHNRIIKTHLLNVTKISLYVYRLLKLGRTKRVWRSKVLDSSVALNRRRLTNEYSLNSFQAIFFSHVFFSTRFSTKDLPGESASFQTMCRAFLLCI